MPTPSRIVVRPTLKPRCKTCKRRKIKCDYARPSCGTCRRSRTPCLGYDDGFIFVQQEFDGNGKATSSCEGRQGIHRARADKPAHGGPVVPLPLERRQPHFSVTLVAPTGAVQNRSMFFDQMLTYFLPASANDKVQVELGWVHRLRELRGNFQPLDTAVNAFATILCARANKDEALNMEAAKLYVAALQGLSRHFRENPTHGPLWHEAALASIMLQYYESSRDTNDRQPVSHLDGISQIMHIGGQQSVEDPRFLATFLMARITMILESLEGVFDKIAAYPWCFRPWGDILQDPLHKCMDALIHVVSYKELANKLCMGDLDDMGMARFHTYRKQVDDRFEGWYLQYVVGGPKPFFYVDPVSGDEPDSLLKSIGYNLRFTDMRSTISMLTYWIGKVLLYEYWEKVHIYRQSLPNTSQEPGWKTENAELAAGLVSVSGMTHNLCLAIRQMLSDDVGIPPIYMVALPTLITYRFFSKHGMIDRQEWLARLLEDVSQRNFRAPFLGRFLGPRLKRYDVKEPRLAIRRTP